LNKKFKLNQIFLFCFVIVLSFGSEAAYSRKTKVKYKTNFGSCPSRTAGQMVMKLIKKFEQNQSLKEVKQEIINKDLASTHFISDYSIRFDPMRKALHFNFICPKPLMKVQVYKDNGLDSYEAILVSNGQLYDPTYEVLLRSDRKLSGDLPFLALPIGSVKNKVNDQLTGLIRKMGDSFRKKVSEVILDKKGEMTVILSLQGSPSSVFMGQGEWNDKLSKLKRIIKTMERKRKIPSIINLTNAKKVVVKFKSNI